MPVDASIPLQLRELKLENPMELQQKAMNLRQLSMQNQALEQESAEKQSMKDILKRNTITGEDGTTSINKGAALSDLYKVNPEKAMAFKKQLEEQDLDDLKRNTEGAYTLAWSATPENWGEIREKAISMGLKNADKLPPVYSPQFVKNWQMGTLSGKEQLAHREKLMELEGKALDRREARDERRFNSGIKMQERQEKQKELSAAESKQLGLYKLGEKAEQQYLSATSDPDEYDPTGSGQFIDNSEWAPNLLKNNKAIEAQAAQSNWVEAFLRDASGAAIPPNERGAYAKDFFPQPGDSKTVVENKAAMRAQKMENARTSAGRAGEMHLAQQTSTAPKSNADSAAIQWAQDNPNDPRAKKILQLNGQTSVTKAGR